MSETASHTPTQPRQPSAPDERDRRVSLLVGDRFCISCGFNLVGQSVVREPHYNMLMVRCPECGTAAAMQEYPMLGRWAARWARVLAVALILLMTVLTFGASLACWGVSIPPVLAMVQPIADKLGDLHVAWQRERAIADAQKAAATAQAQPDVTTPGDLASISRSPDLAIDPPGSGSSDASSALVADSSPLVTRPEAPSAAQVIVNGVAVPPALPAIPGLNIPADEDWWRRRGHSNWAQSGEPKAALAGAGGWATNIDWAGLKWLVVSLPVAFLFGVVFSILLLGRSRWKAMLIIPVVFTLSTCWALIDKLDDSSQWGGDIQWMAVDLAGFPLHVIVFLFMAYAMSMGIWCGRAIARAVVRIMLPPRLCGSLADLWLCDGKAPPYGAMARAKVR